MLSGVRLIEVAAIGPATFCGMLFADLGADVILVDRREVDSGATNFGDATLLNRGKRSIALDLKSRDDRVTFMDLVASADALIEGFRPGVMERLGVGPNECLARNPRLVYGRATGWGQTGPLSQIAGHDHNYLALSGALWYAGMPGTPPYTPPTLVGDVGGALYLAIGLLTGIVKSRETGKGGVVDAAMYDASSHMMNLVLALRQLDAIKTERGTSMFDGSHWSRTYRCACGGFVSIQCTEFKFYRVFLDRLGLGDAPLFAEQNAPAMWPEQAAYLEKLFLTRSREEWCEVFRDSDACFAPVLNLDEAAAHPQNDARGTYVYAGGMLQAALAPRFSIAPQWHPRPSPRRGEHAQEILASLANSPKHLSQE
jgi:acetyl-CoA hydrolase